MGLNKNSERTTYLTISDGKLVKAHKQPTADTAERINKAGKVVYEEHFLDLTGKLVDISVRESEQFGKQWQLKFIADGETFVVQMPFSGRNSSSFLKVLPNVNLKQEMKFKPWSMADRNDLSKKVSGITVYQGGKILPFYTKDEPNGLPEMKQLKVKGKVTWDDSDMMDFLEDMVNSEIVPKLKSINVKNVDTETEEEDEVIEDLPFD
jgi:hypothetical protein